jgi:hypothetical protein
MSETIEVFISYSKQDKEFRDRLLAHLRPLEREGIVTWHDRQILPGTEWDEEIKARLNAADIILLLISADFLATDYCNRVEIPEALQRHEADEAIVMPVILRSCSWQYTPLAKIQAYPEKAEPIRSWKDIDEAYTNVVNGVYLTATKIKERRSQQQAEQKRIQQEPQRQVEEQERLHPAEQLRQQPATEEARLKWQEEIDQEAERKQHQEPANQQQSTNALRGDYAQLASLLKGGKWREADVETAKQMCQVMGEQENVTLEDEQIKNFPCADLQAIDQLWVKYSNGKFGFSVQKKIWQQYGSPTVWDKQWEKFGEEVGWRSKGLKGFGACWKDYPHLTFDLSAPTGHLPAYVALDIVGAVWDLGDVRRLSDLSMLLKGDVLLLGVGVTKVRSLTQRCVDCKI